MDARIVGPDSLTWGIWKYVGFADGTFRFCLVETGIKHTQIAATNMSAPVRAGFIAFTPEMWKLQNAISDSLDIMGNEDEDRAALAAVLGREAML